MGMFDRVVFEEAEDLLAEGEEFQSKDGPCLMYDIHRDELDPYGAYVINHYHGHTKDGWRVFGRGPDGWIEITPPGEARTIETNRARSRARLEEDST